MVTLSLTRRSLALGAMTTLGARARTTGAVGQDSIAAIERRYGGRLGVFVLGTGSGRTLARRADERFIMCSTMKGVLAAMLLSRIDAGQDGPDPLVSYGKANLLSHSPVTSAHVETGQLPVETLCSAIVLYSDNGAANLLLARVGGPAAGGANRLRARARRQGDAHSAWCGSWSGLAWSVIVSRPLTGVFSTPRIRLFTA